MTVAIAPRTIYDGRDLSSGYTWDVDLTNSYFYGCNLSGVDLSQVTSFKGCEFYWCNMTGTKFTGLDLRNLNFGSGPTLQWCNLTSADFTNANLSYVNLTGNTLTGVTISGATTTGTIGLIGVGAINITGPPVVGYTAWFHADSLSLANGASVVQLTDSSTNTNHAVQSTPGKRGTYVASATNGRPAVTFDGTATWYATSGTFDAGTVFLVCNHTDAGSTFADYRRILDTDDGAGWSIVGVAGSSLYNPSALYRGIDATHFWVNGTLSDVATPFASYRVVSGVPASVSTQILSVGTFSTSGTPSGAQLFKGNLCEYVIYPTALSTGNRQSVEAYLKTKYGL